MGDIFAFRSDIELITGNRNANQVVARRTSVGGTGALRKGLVDVTNLQQKPKLADTDSKTLPFPVATKECIDQLCKENLALTKLLAERNKIIELTGAELQRLRVNLQMTHQQNWQLAQANSQMLAELNAGKDRLKVLQHELGCLKCMLSVKNPDVQEKQKVGDCLQTHNKMQATKLEEAGESSLSADNKGIKQSKTNIRRLSRASSTSATKDSAAKEKSETKRPCKRRQSCRLKSEEPGSTEDLFEIDDANFLVGSQLNDAKLEDSSTVSASEDYKKDTKEGENAISGSLPTEMRGRSSLGRPLRRAAEKVQTYKEIPLNVKMRRSD